MRDDHKIRLKALNAEVRFRIEGPTFVENEHGKMKQISNGGVHCDIIDATVRGAPYATATGADQTLALEAALTAAEKAEKPLTPAQKADAAKQSNGLKQTAKAAMERADKAEAEAEALKKKLAEAEAKLAAKKPETDPPANVTKK